MRRTTKHMITRVLTCMAFFYCLLCWRLFLPPSIQSADILHLGALGVVWQNFPVDQVDDSIFSNETIPVTVELEEIRKYLKSWSTEVDFAPKSVLSEFLPPMTLLDREKSLMTLETYIRACELTKLTYFSISGTILGAYRHHGFIPWDDDIDVVMNASEWRKIRYVLSHVPGYQLYAPSKHQWKFFMKNLPPQRDKPFKWPNIDIYFFTEDSTYIWGLTSRIKGKLFAKKSDFFPLQYRPFENQKVAVPCNFEDLILKAYDTEICGLRINNHKAAKSMNISKWISCKELHHAYPFVFRSKGGVGGVVEVLKVGDRVVRNITLSNFCVSK